MWNIRFNVMMIQLIPRFYRFYSLFCFFFLSLSLYFFEIFMIILSQNIWILNELRRDQRATTKTRLKLVKYTLYITHTSTSVMLYCLYICPSNPNKWIILSHEHDAANWLPCHNEINAKKNIFIHLYCKCLILTENMS